MKESTVTLFPPKSIASKASSGGGSVLEKSESFWTLEAGDGFVLV